MRKVMAAAVGVMAIGMASPALADIKAGVDAWSRGDYKAAVEQWRGPAVAGDADAQFNLGQAYKLGRGVPLDPVQAESWFRKAATQGHLQAQDNYGLALYQDHKLADAMPWLEKSVARGEPRAQLVLGTMLFKRRRVGRDYPRAYALMSRASEQGLPSASETMAQMDQYISPADREKGTALAQQYAAQANALPRPTRDPAIVAGRQGMRQTDVPPSRVAQQAPPPPPPARATQVRTAPIARPRVLPGARSEQRRLARSAPVVADVEDSDASSDNLRAQRDEAVSIVALVRRVRAAGLPCGVMIAPVLPYLTDSDEALTAVLTAVAEAGATGVTVLPLHLRPRAREWFLSWLARLVSRACRSLPAALPGRNLRRPRVVERSRGPRRPDPRPARADRESEPAPAGAGEPGRPRHLQLAPGQPAACAPPVASSKVVCVGPGDGRGLNVSGGHHVILQKTFRSSL